MLTIQQECSNECELCEICDKSVNTYYNVWHPRAAWSGVWITICELCLEAMEVNL